MNNVKDAKGLNYEKQLSYYAKASTWVFDPGSGPSPFTIVSEFLKPIDKIAYIYIYSLDRF